jgi:hypothetical protein
MRFHGSGKRTGDTGKNWTIYNSGNSIQGLYDPWGQPYRILLDAKMVISSVQKFS